MFINLNA